MWTSIQQYPEIPHDDYADAHGQVGAYLEGGMYVDNPQFASYLVGLGHVLPWTAADTYYATRHAGPGGRSLMAGIVAYLYALRLIGYVSGPQAPVGDDYPGKPIYADVLKRLEGYGLTIATAGYSEQYFFAKKYWENELTVENDVEWMARERGLYWLPEAYEIEKTQAQGLFAQLETGIAQWGLLGTEEKRKAALDTYFKFEAHCVPLPGEPEVVAPVMGSLIVNPRRVFYTGRKVENQLVIGHPSNAAKSCTRIDWLIGATSKYLQWSMDTNLLSPNDWRSVLGLPLDYGTGGYGGIGIGGGARP